MLQTSFYLSLINMIMKMALMSRCNTFITNGSNHLSGTCLNGRMTFWEIAGFCIMHFTESNAERCGATSCCNNTLQWHKRKAEGSTSLEEKMDGMRRGQYWWSTLQPELEMRFCQLLYLSTAACSLTFPTATLSAALGSLILWPCSDRRSYPEFKH